MFSLGFGPLTAVDGGWNWEFSKVQKTNFPDKDFNLKSTWIATIRMVQQLKVCHLIENTFKTNLIRLNSNNSVKMSFSGF